MAEYSVVMKWRIRQLDQRRDFAVQGFTQIYVLLDTIATNSVVGVTKGPFDVPRRINVHVFTYIL